MPAFVLRLELREGIVEEHHTLAIRRQWGCDGEGAALIMNRHEVHTARGCHDELADDDVMSLSRNLSDNMKWPA